MLLRLHHVENVFEEQKGTYRTTNYKHKQKRRVEGEGKKLCAQNRDVFSLDTCMHSMAKANFVTGENKRLKAT